MDTAFSNINKETEELPFAHSGSVNIDVANLLYSLSKTLQPQVILEIGCFFGFSTLHFAQAIKENGHGSIYSVDLFDQTLLVEDTSLSIYGKN